MKQFEIPVVLFLFKREEKTVRVLNEIRKVKPKRLYLISDGPRNSQEAIRVKECRKRVEDAIDWDCEVVKNYATQNKGVYDRIGLGAKWVFEQEDVAIFLEDDNLPEETFFPFCEEILERYKNDTRVFWICGTNYLEDYQPEDNSSYVFTRHMMPCGWASWSNKFLKYYDGDLSLWNDPFIKRRIKDEYIFKPLLRQDQRNWDREKYRIENKERPNSWDYQMSFTQRVHGLFAVVPRLNQIKNIGVDRDSIHNGYSLDNIMTSRFCQLETYRLEFPLKHPKVVWVDQKFERILAEYITLPRRYRVKGWINRFLKRILFINQNKSLTQTVLGKFFQEKRL